MPPIVATTGLRKNARCTGPLNAPTYSTTHTASEISSAAGIVRCGFFVSCPSVEIESNPTYAKNKIPADRITPEIPKLPETPVLGGMNGTQLCG